MKLSNQEIIDALISRDEYITQQFFFGNCRPLFISIIRSVFSYEVDYDEFVNELYLHIMENDAYRLRQFQGRSSIYQWLKVVAIRYFIAKRDNLIEMEQKDSPLSSEFEQKRVDTERQIVAEMDVEFLLSRMFNKRYVYIIRRLVLDDADPKVVAKELKTTVENIYNIKKRALAALTSVALNEVVKYEKNTDK